MKALSLLVATLVLSLFCNAYLGVIVLKNRLIGPVYTIGLVYTPSRQFHDNVNHALIQSIVADGRFFIKKFTPTATTDLDSINEICREAIASDVDAIICAGMSCSQGMVRASKECHSTKPIIFLGTQDPIAFGLVESLEHPGANVTGVFCHSLKDNFSPIDLLLMAKPTARNILVPYSVVVDRNEAYAQELAQRYVIQGIHITLLPIDTMEDTVWEVAAHLPGHDTVMYLEADAVAAHAPMIGKLIASQNNVTFFAGSIDGGKNAVLSYAADPVCLAEMAFDMAKKVLLQHKNPGDIPVQEIAKNRVFMINIKLCQEQGLSDIDIQRVVNALRRDERFGVVHDNIVVR
ncbi:MAG: putative tryptophan/tyrosine transport system substrate-binding protein [Candidatus Dependentiae bacterium]|nr:putative tryptophan/tyrosine transport system substrate-binding protein [Candidatus Dependentiae bacterium]